MTAASVLANHKELVVVVTATIKQKKHKRLMNFRAVLDYYLWITPPKSIYVSRVTLTQNLRCTIVKA